MEGFPGVEGSREVGSVVSVAVDGTCGSSLTVVDTGAGSAGTRLRICLETCLAEEDAEEDAAVVVSVVVSVVVVEGTDNRGKRDQRKTCTRRIRR